jgi:hypothetical protein
MPLQTVGAVKAVIPVVAQFDKVAGCPSHSTQKAGGNMSSDTIEKLITNAIHTAFIKYPEGDGGPNLDYEWIPPEQSSHITKAILLDLEASGFQIVKKA